ncbi:MAG TPA: ferritin family protein [Synergistaceae bacterium]|jgi:rubrerythrin|nr:ferritin family protein [Synergistaceae bacterium]HQH77836.1 ferritin family protein [Synergistaceae bacterium]HQK24520.1 ferritin family protein [Synergistaceae bacterium]
MTERAFDMKHALRYAIHSEYHAAAFYRQWAQETSGAAKEQIEGLAEWEDQHRRSLSGYYARLFGEEVNLDPSFGVDPGLVVQADEFRNHYALVRIASTVYVTEMRAAEMYDQMARHAADPEGAKIFSDIADMERGHMQEALAMYQRLREDQAGSLML